MSVHVEHLNSTIKITKYRFFQLIGIEKHSISEELLARIPLIYINTVGSMICLFIYVAVSTKGYIR